MAKKAACGTYAGCQAHRRRGEVVCQPCKDAGSAYMRGRRARNIDLVRQDERRRKVRRRAVAALVARYPEEFEALVQAELRLLP